jgi:hypothetical protein
LVVVTGHESPRVTALRVEESTWLSRGVTVWGRQSRYSASATEFRGRDSCENIATDGAPAHYRSVACRYFEVVRGQVIRVLAGLGTISARAMPGGTSQ